MRNDIRFLHPAALGPPRGYHSPGALVSNPAALLFIAGQIAADSAGETVGEGDIGLQARQVFVNIGHVLDEAGLAFRDVVKFTTYIVGPERVAGFVDERALIFPQIFGDGPFPPNTLVVIDRLARSQFLIEIEAIAVGYGDP